MTRNSFRGNNNSNHFFARLNVEPPQSRSLENLVLNSAAIGQSSAMTTLEDSASGVTVERGDRVEEEQENIGNEGDQRQERRRDSSKSRHNSSSSVI